MRERPCEEPARAVDLASIRVRLVRVRQEEFTDGFAFLFRPALDLVDTCAEEALPFVSVTRFDFLFTSGTRSRADPDEVGSVRPQPLCRSNGKQLATQTRDQRILRRDVEVGQIVVLPWKVVVPAAVDTRAFDLAR